MKETRYGDNGCNCFICLTARKKGHEKPIQGRGNVRNQSLEIGETSGLYGASRSESVPTKPPDKIEKQESLEICGKCFQKIQELHIRQGFVNNLF